MAKIDFKLFKLYTGISHDGGVVQDISEEVANMVYRNSGGISALALAMKIYKGEKDYEEEEVELLMGIVNRFGTPLLIDSMGVNIIREEAQ